MSKRKRTKKTYNCPPNSTQNTIEWATLQKTRDERRCSKKC